MKISKIIGIIFLSIIFIYILMFLNTNSLVKKIEQHMLGEIKLTPEIEQKLLLAEAEAISEKKSIFDYTLTDDLPLYELYNFNYAKKHNFPTAEKDKIYFKLRRNYVLHNFKDGIMNYTYTLRYFDKYGKKAQGIKENFITATIHKEKGEWHIVDIVWKYI